MPLSPLQRGHVGELAFLILAIVTGNGEIEAYTPVIDEEQRDAEIHRRGRFLSALGIQVKITNRLEKQSGGARRLKRRFWIPKAALSSKSLWYFFGHFDLETLQFSDPIFLIPSSVVHKRCRSGTRRGSPGFMFNASIEPGSHDEWVEYRVHVQDLGSRLLEILKDLEGNRRLTLADEDLPADSVIVGRLRSTANLAVRRVA